VGLFSSCLNINASRVFVRFHAEAAIGEDKRSREGQHEDKKFFHSFQFSGKLGAPQWGM
jgi:hypothetical protein